MLLRKPCSPPIRRWEEVASLELPYAWVRRVCVNLATSVVRRRIVEARALLKISRRRSDVSELDADDGELWAAVRRLPRRQTQCIALRYVYDLPLAEIAAVIGCAEGTVKVHLARGRTTLAGGLGNRSTQAKGSCDEPRYPLSARCGRSTRVNPRRRRHRPTRSTQARRHLATSDEHRGWRSGCYCCPGRWSMVRSQCLGLRLRTLTSRTLFYAHGRRFRAGRSQPDVQVGSQLQADITASVPEGWSVGADSGYVQLVNDSAPGLAIRIGGPIVSVWDSEAGKGVDLPPNVCSNYPERCPSYADWLRTHRALSLLDDGMVPIDGLEIPQLQLRVNDNAPVVNRPNNGLYETDGLRLAGYVGAGSGWPDWPVYSRGQIFTVTIIELKGQTYVVEALGADDDVWQLAQLDVALDVVLDTMEVPRP